MASSTALTASTCSTGPVGGNVKAAERYAAKPIQRDAAAPVQPSETQWRSTSASSSTDCRSLRSSQEQSDQADLQRRRRTVREGPDPASFYSSLAAASSIRSRRDEVRFCTQLRGKQSCSALQPRLAGRGRQPTEPRRLKTDFLWKQILSPSSLTTSWSTTRRSSRRRLADGEEEARYAFATPSSSTSVDVVLRPPSV